MLCVPRANRLNPAGIFSILRKQCHPARNQNTRQRARSRKRHHHRRQPLVARRNSEHSRARRQRSHQAAKHNRSIVAIRQRIQHSRSSLRPAVTGIGACSRKRHGVERFQLTRSLGNQQANLPVSRVESKRDRTPIRTAKPAMRAQNQNLRPQQARRIPSHPRILRQAEEISRGLGQQHLRRNRKKPRWPGSVRRDRRKVQSRRVSSTELSEISGMVSLLI